MSSWLRQIFQTQEPAGIGKKLTPLEAYLRSEKQKEVLANSFLQRIINLYIDNKKLTQQSGISAAVSEYIAIVDEKLDGTAATDEAIADAVRRGYREYVFQKGVIQLDPKSLDFESNLDQFYKYYLMNFPVLEEQESYEGFKELLSAEALANGYKEVAFNVVCPLWNEYLMGINFVIQPESNSVHFIYGFAMPHVRRAIGFAVPMLEAIRRIARHHIAQYGTRYPGELLITFEKNILGEMTLPEILMDTSGIDVMNPPVEGSDLSQSGVGQSVRDLIWDRLGAKIIGYKYIQPSLDGVTRVESPEDRALAIRYLIEEPELTPDEKKNASAILAKALGDKVEGCLVLNLCTFAPLGTKTIDASRLQLAIETFTGVSVIKAPEMINQDIYFEAATSDLSRNTKGGMVPLHPIRPFGVEMVETFKDAEQVTKILLGHLTWEELSGNANRTYSEWIGIKRNVIERDFALYKASTAS